MQANRNKCASGEVQLLDVAQCATVWKALGNMWGVEYGVAMDGYLAELQAEAGGTQPLSELEAKVVTLLRPQIDVCSRETCIPLAEFRGY